MDIILSKKHLKIKSENYVFVSSWQQKKVLHVKSGSKSATVCSHDNQNMMVQKVVKAKHNIYYSDGTQIHCHSKHVKVLKNAAEADKYMSCTVRVEGRKSIKKIVTIRYVLRTSVTDK